MVLAATNTTALAAFAVGFASFVSPCVLPLVPGYLSAVSGVSVAELQAKKHSLGKVLLPSLLFCLSFTTMFVALGMTATGLGQTLNDHRALLDKIAGGIILALGTFMLATPFVTKLNRQWRPEKLIIRAGNGSPIVAGLAFAFAWTPCVGPTLGSILTAASTSSSVGRGGILLACYSAGLAVPFLACAIAFDRATTAFRWLRDRYIIITALSGVVLIIMGLLILTGQLTELNSEAQKLLSKLGLDFLYRF